MDDTLLTFSEETVSIDTGTSETWKILIVDDDQDVHSVTELVMHGVVIMGRALEFLHAFRVDQAIRLLEENRDIAVILLDVVMEDDNAGFQLVRHVREAMALHSVRIILRTGQPGYAPEYEAIRDYDINDYRTKSEFSYARFLTSLTSAIRSYIQITRISKNADFLSHIIQSAPGMLAQTDLDSFETAITALIKTILVKPFNAWILHREPQDYLKETISNYPVVHKIAGNLNTGIGTVIDLTATNIPQDFTMVMIDLIRESSENHINVYKDTDCVLFFSGYPLGDLFLVLSTDDLADNDIQKLMELSAVAISMSYQNMNLLQQLWRLAYQDNVTGLLNRIGIINEVDKLRSQGTNQQSLALIDIEGFSELNEALGHQYGDAILVAVSRRLADHFKGEALCARVGGDTFVILGREPALIPERILSIFAHPFGIHQHSMYLRMVCGIVRLDEVQGDGADLLKDAFLAVKTAKTQRQNRFAYYNPRVEAENRQRILLLEELQRAIETKSLTIFYQPQVDLRNARVTGLEALLRWKQADGSFIPPSVFIPLAEQSGLIVDLGDWLIQEVFRQKNLWNLQGLKDFRVAINVSVRQFYNPGFIEYLSNAMLIHNITPEEVELEITESMAMNAIDEVIIMLNNLKRVGIKIALDDFGTGFSSLSYLQRLPIDRIKIDQAFVSTIHSVEKQRAIVQTIIRLGNSLGLELIAEGVEQEAQQAVLNELGCPEAQGYYFGKPMDYTSCTTWLKQNMGIP